MLITTGSAGAPEIVQRAVKLAEATGGLYVPRGRFSVHGLARHYNESEVIVVLEQGVRLVQEGAPALEYHPSMGFIRAKRVLKGGSDPMLEAADLRPGDHVLDCTAGLGTDSLVFAVAAGPEGKVIACESSVPLYALIREGMGYYRVGMPAVDEALARIDIRCQHHLDALRNMPDRSMDIVYFDPMFRQPLKDSSAIGPLRGFANNEALQSESVKEAKRVARKTVVLKEKRGSGEFARLGFQVLDRPHSNTVYGVIRIDSRV